MVTVGGALVVVSGLGSSVAEQETNAMRKISLSIGETIRAGRVLGL